MDAPYPEEDRGTLEWELVAAPDAPELGIIVDFRTGPEARAFLKKAGFLPTDITVNLPAIYDPLAAWVYTHPKAGRIVLARRRLNPPPAPPPAAS